MYTLENYYKDIAHLGLNTTWKKILQQDIPSESSDFSVYKLGERYEEGLALENKIEKKEMGKYYTPEDVALVMAKTLLPITHDDVICDVCCGVGNLILPLLDILSEDIRNNIPIYLYDIDTVALDICVYTIKKLYGDQCASNIHHYYGDFLGNNITLPQNSVVISNPPYGKISTVLNSWTDSPVIADSKDFYSAIMDKILAQSKKAVIITPHSFMGSDKFFSLRERMNNYTGYIWSFDNVPGNIFNGRKHGIFNTNNVNSVRAAITVKTENAPKGFQIGPYIRFSSGERASIVSYNYLNKLPLSDYQIISKEHLYYYRYLKETEQLVKNWLSQDSTLGEYLTSISDYPITVPNTCRYYTVGALKPLKRTGKNIIYAKNLDAFCVVYGWLNSSFCYYYHRMCNGGITYPITLLKNMPIIKLNTDQIKQLKNIIKEMIASENQYVSYKKNAGVLQENIKFPEEYRNRLNQIFCEAIDIKTPIDAFTAIHANCSLEEED